MITLIAIDPGVHECGVAVFRGKKLERGSLETCADWIDLSHTYAGIVVERPEYQGARTQNAKIQTTMNLCWSGSKMAYYIAGAVDGDVKEITPTQWKGQLPKPIAHAHLWEVLTVAERELLGGIATADAIADAQRKGAAKRWPPGYNPYPKRFTMHNVLDAVAIGCVELGRLTLVGGERGG